MNEGTLRVLVATRKVPVKTVEHEVPVYGYSGQRLGSRRSTSVVYERTLDDQNQRVLDEARRLSETLGLKLEVVDRSSSGLLRRTLAAFSGLGLTGMSFSFTPEIRAAACSTDPGPSLQ